MKSVFPESLDKVLNPQIGRKDMTDKEIFEAGIDGFYRGWSNIPPFSIASVPRAGRPTAAEIWQNGWRKAKEQRTLELN